MRVELPLKTVYQVIHLRSLIVQIFIIVNIVDGLAVNYALKWAEGRNGDFYSYSDQGEDCTNFFSQCLHAGGLRITKEWHSYKKTKHGLQTVRRWNLFACFE